MTRPTTRLAAAAAAGIRSLPSITPALQPPNMDVHHAACDQQSLRTTEAALEELRRFPHLLHDVENTLEHWNRVAPVDTKPLRDRWRCILACGAWAEALDSGQAGHELRKTSPLGKALSQAQRLAITRACRNRS